MKGGPTGSDKDNDADTLGLDWDAEANRGGAELGTASVAMSAITTEDLDTATASVAISAITTEDVDTASIAMSAITTPGTLLVGKAPTDNKKNPRNNSNSMKGGPAGSAKDKDSKSASEAAAHANNRYTTISSSDTGGEASNDRGCYCQETNLPPGAYRIAGPDYNSGSDDQNDSLISNTPNIGGGESVIHDDDIVVEGFVPEPSENDLRGVEAAARAQALLDAAITLDESAIKKIPDDVQDEEEGEKETVGETGGETHTSSSAVNVAVGDAKSTDKTLEKKKSPFAFIALTGIILAAIALAVGLSSSSRGTGSSDEDLTLISVSRACFVSHSDRYEYAKQMVSKITSLETLDDESTNQNKALTWLVCNDTISANLIDGRDVETGELPKQIHGSMIYTGDAGETQVLRRYALATFYFSTTMDGPWINSWNFLNGSRHECYWHKNYTRDAWSNGGAQNGVDSAGVHCFDDSFSTMNFNFRSECERRE